MKLKLLILLWALLSTVSAGAYDFMYTHNGKNLYFDILPNGNTVALTSESYDSSDYSGSVEIPESVVNNSKTYTVTVIQYRAFKDCSGLTSVTIPNSVTLIESIAFQNCSGLTSITIPNSVTSIESQAFQNCSGLTSITIPNSVTSIERETFQNCSGLTSITIPNSVKSIGNYAFGSCSGLTSVTIPNSVTSIGVGAFSGTALYDNASNWENGVLYIGKHLICAKYKEVNGAYNIKDGTLTIANNAFGNCSSLTSVTIPNSVTSIGDNTFQYCSSLTSVTIPNSVTSIGSDAFYGTALYDNASNWENGVLYIGNHLVCSNYNEVFGAYNIKDGTLTIANGAFADRDLTSVTIPNSVTSIGANAFSLCYNLTSVTIPNSVISIGNYAFYYCSGLSSVTIPNSVTSIGGGTFTNCRQLTSVTIPNSVTSIGFGAFDGSGLTSVTIPNSVKSIGDYAFGRCSGLTSVTVLVDDPQKISLTLTDDPSAPFCYDIFHMTPISSCTLNVPKGSKARYEADSQWNGFGTIEEVEIPREPYYFSVDETDMPAERVTLLPVTMVNEGSIIGFQFDVVLPEGFTLAKNAKDRYYLDESERFIDHNVTAREVDGAVRFIAVSLDNNTPFSDNDGVLCSLPVIPSGDPRQAEIEICNITLSDSKSQAIYVAPVTAIVNVQPPYTLGDANNDGYINVADVTITISAILGNEQSNFVRKAADINADGYINVADVTAIINMLLNQSSSQKAPAKAPIHAAPAKTPELSISDVTISRGGKAIIEISLDNAEDCRDVEFNINLPNEDFQIVTKDNNKYVINKTDRTSGHTVSSSYSGEDAYKVLIIGMDGDIIKAGSGPIATIEIATNAEPGTYTYSISDIVISDNNAQGYRPANQNATITVEQSINYEDFQFYAYPTTIDKGDKTTMTINFNATGNVSAYEFEIELPAGVEVEYLEEDDDYNIDIDKVIKNFDQYYEYDPTTGIITMTGRVRKSNAVYEESDELYATIVLDTENLAPGEYTIMLKNQSVTSGGNVYTPADFAAKLIVNANASTYTIVDGTPYTNDTDEEYETITYTRSCGNTAWKALYLPFDIPYEVWSELGDIVEFTGATPLDRNGDGINEGATLEFRRVTTAMANTPYLFLPKSAGDVTFTVNNATLQPAPATDASVSQATAEYIITLYGNYENKTGLYAQGAYALSTEGQFVPAETPDQILKPYRIYMKAAANGQAMSAPMLLSVTVDGEVTGIEDIEIIQQVDGRCYDLLGRPVANPQNGIYIRGGQKVIVK